MGKDRDIDELFQEKLINFESVPDAKIWEAIESELDKKKKKRFVPVWLFRGAVASVVVLFSVLFFQKFGEGEIKKTNVVVEVENNELQNNHIIDSNQIKKTITDKKVRQINKPTMVAKSTKKPSNNTLKNTFQPENKYNKSATLIKHELATTKTNIKVKEVDKLNNKQPNKIAKQKIVVENTNKFGNDSLEKNKTKNLIPFKGIEEGNIATKETKKSSWFIQPSIGLLSSKTSSESPILANSNNIQSDNFSSYGLKVGVVLNEKWAVQTGVFSQKLSYQTNNISDVFSISSAISLQNNDIVAFPEPGDVTNINQERLYKVQQSFSYVEVPLEVTYTMLKLNNFSTGIVLGGSSYFLTDKDATISFDTNVISGNTKNINTIHFSANFGLNLNYKLSKSFNLNLNPMVKKPLNTFSDNNFNPYQFGVYSGFSFTF